MKKTESSRFRAVALALLALAASAPPAPAQTSPVSGEATVIQATVALPAGLGTETITLGSTGALLDDGDALEAALPTGSIASVGGGNVLHATAISSINDWSAGEGVASEASLADLTLAVGGRAISASFVMAQADVPVGGAATGWSAVEDLAVDGLPIVPTGAENQTISLPGLTLVLNEVHRTASGISVNALRITSQDGLVDVVVARATAGLEQ